MMYHVLYMYVLLSSHQIRLLYMQHTLKVERVCALLDPRRKSLDNCQIVNGSAALRTRPRGGLQGAHRNVCGRAHAIACASAGVVGGKPGDHGTHTREEEAFENG